MKKTLIIFGICLVSLMLPKGFIFADDQTATSSPLQKAIQSVQDTVDNLITAKDENSPQETSLRVDTFNQVINLVDTEAKDLQVKLLL